jgi:hypothetical protein
MRPILFALALLAAGCGEAIVHPPPADTSTDVRDSFAPASMRLHPVFTQVKSFSGGTAPDGIEAVLEFDDAFGDPTKAAGAIIFELYPLQHGTADHRGDRLVEPWTASLANFNQQQAHWRREMDAYSFLLADSKVNYNDDYVLLATFEPLNGTRLFAQTIIHARLTPADRYPAQNP